MGENAETNASDEDDLPDLLDVGEGKLLGSTGLGQVHLEGTPAVLEPALEDLAVAAPVIAAE